MSPTAPTYLALYERLGQAQRRIRELTAREDELLAEIRTLRAASPDARPQLGDGNDSSARQPIALRHSSVPPSNPDRRVRKRISEVGELKACSTRG